MSSFRRAKTEASLRLYSLPRRELQALCKQYGIPTNKTNVAMADALSACVPVDTAKPKANSLRVPKTTPLKLKVDGVTGLPETSLMSSGKWKGSLVKLSEMLTVADREEESFLKPNITPMRRGVKRSERPLIQTPHEEKTKATVIPAFTLAGLHDRFGKSVAATSNHRRQAPTPRKRPGKVVETVTRRGGDALPPGSFSDIEMSTEIEYRNAALHEELLGVRRDITMLQEDRDVTPVAREIDYRGDVSESSEEVGFEFRNMALHKELLGLHPKPNATNSQGYYGHSPAHDLQQPGASSVSAIHLVSSERGIFKSPSTSTELLDYSGHEIRVLSSIREEDASDDSDSKVEKLEEHIQRHRLPQGRDLGPLLYDMSCDESPACSLSRMEEENNLVFEQAESSAISPTRCMSLTPIIQNSPLVNAATPLTKIRINIDSTLTKATLILEKLATLRADAEKKTREGYWEPKFSAVMENASPSTVFKTALVVGRDLPSAKKARLTPKAILSSEKELVVCEDADIVSKGEIPSAKTIPIADESRDLMSVVSNKENQFEKKSMVDWNSRKLGGLCKAKKGKQIEVLKDRSKNMSDQVNNEINAPEYFKSGTGGVRPEEMSLRKLRAQFKERIRHLEASKASDLRPWSERISWNTSH